MEMNNNEHVKVILYASVDYLRQLVCNSAYLCGKVVLNSLIYYYI